MIYKNTLLPIPCLKIQPSTKSCLAHNAYSTSAAFRKTFPLYFSLTFVAFVVLCLQKFMDAPFKTSWHAVIGVVWSTTSLSSFIGIFQTSDITRPQVGVLICRWISCIISALGEERKKMRTWIVCSSMCWGIFVVYISQPPCSSRYQKC
uniref:Uncharacterized protein n=1 Tax=Lactuca sativa TaxID=4236 RepID=A0A9R1XB23_LACSA|nr:hypothetical protein LSAT_V11C500287290 [Lactuca sativa]